MAGRSLYCPGISISHKEVDMDGPQAPSPTKRSLGKTITTIGVGMFALSMVLIYVLGVSGAMLHNVLQLGGLLLAVIGLVMWKVLKK